MDYHVGVLFQHFFGVRGNGHAPRRVLCAHHFAQVASHFRRIGVDGADNFDGLFFPHQPRNRCADRPDPVLDGANFLFHFVLRPALRSTHTPHFRVKRNPYDNGIPSRIQRRTAPWSAGACYRFSSPRSSLKIRRGSPQSLLERRLPRIMARTSIGHIWRLHHASEEAHRSGNLSAAAKGQRLEPSPTENCTRNLPARTLSRRSAT